MAYAQNIRLRPVQNQHVTWLEREGEAHTLIPRHQTDTSSEVMRRIKEMSHVEIIS